MTFREFLQEALPELGLAWKPHDRKGVRRRCIRRMDSRRIRSWEAYLQRLRRDPQEMEIFSRLVQVTICRFFRNAEVFQRIEDSVLPELLQAVEGGGSFRVWSAGCGNGEEPYSVAMIWEMSHLGRGALVVDAQDMNPGCIRRARERRYGLSTLMEVPPHYLTRFFEPQEGAWILREEVSRWTRFHVGDLRFPPSPEPYHLVLCRNTTFTYGTRDTQLRVLRHLRSRLVPGGYLVIGKKERLPVEEGWDGGDGLGILQRVD